MTILDTALQAGYAAVSQWLTDGRHHTAWPRGQQWQGAVDLAAERAWLGCAPALDSADGVRAHLSYVLHGRSLNFVSATAAQSHLYAAQTAIAALRVERRLSPARPRRAATNTKGKAHGKSSSNRTS